MDSTDRCPDEPVRTAWSMVRRDARTIEAHVRHNWAQAIIEAHTHQNGLALTAASATNTNARFPSNTDQSLSDARRAERVRLHQDLQEYAIDQLRVTGGDIPEALYNTEQHFRSLFRCSKRGGEEAGPADAATRAWTLARRVNEQWAQAIENTYSDQ
jgi:hypothetical protein